ncbi:hypothetical protein ACYSNR_06290 [Enterococcus sp. LJL128]|uniref:hypothetical protein n=1 Tax=Enterococcus sp. LJL51 TaxID=3416656 RepID=UPI003CEC919C
MEKKKTKSMFRVLEDTEKIVNASTGMKIRLPKPGKRSLEISTVTNSALGVGLTVFGLCTPHKWAILLGAASIAGGIITYQEAKRIQET